MNIVEILCVFAVVTEGVLTSGEDVTVCEDTKHPDVKYFDVRLPYMNVPENLTSYVCDLQRVMLTHVIYLFIHLALNLIPANFFLHTSM